MNSIPEIDIQEFRASQLTGNEEFSYSEIKGFHHIDQPHTHNFLLFVLFEKGKGLHTIDFKEYKLEDKQVHLLFPKQLHTWKLDKITEGYQLMIDKEFFEKNSITFTDIFAYYQQLPVITLSDKIFQLLHNEFKEIKNELRSDTCFSNIIQARIQVIISIIIKEINLLISNSPLFCKNFHAIKFQSLLDDFFQQEKSVQFYADQLNISVSYLTKICKKHLNYSPTELIMQRTILEAKRLLKSTNLSIKEIAYELGFVDSPYFSNFFKKHTGITPSQFRG